jgi:L-ascorbate metabolism protein UlaG (beta-lactamase superfamily)
MAFRYLPLLESFASNPSVHIAATRDPRLFGGPFVNLPISAVPGIKTLIASTRQRLGPLLQLANDLVHYDRALQQTCRGFSLNERYKMLPPSLAGMVELMYDLNDHPRLHLIEELLYEEYGETLRAGVREVMLSTVHEVDRPFFLSTPRMPSLDELVIATDFANPALDLLTSMRSTPTRIDDLQEQLHLSNLAQRYSPLFSDRPPARSAGDYFGDGVRVRYFGHACVLVQTPTTAVLLDPMFAIEPTSGNDPASGDLRLTINDLPARIDYLVLSHCHQDHFSPEMLLQIRPRIRKVLVPLNNSGNLADPSMKLSLSQLGFSDVQSLRPFDKVPLSDGHLVSLPFPGEHCDLDIYSKHSLFLTLRGRRLIFLVDSDGWDASLYKRIAALVVSGQRVDALFLGMECHGAPLTWLYGPLLTKPISRRDDESRRLSASNHERARRIVETFACSRVFVYAMGQEPWLRYMMGLEYDPDSIQLRESDKLIAYCRSEGIPAERLLGSRDIAI